MTDWADEQARAITGPCSCSELHKAAGTTASDCMWHVLGVEIAVALRAARARGIKEGRHLAAIDKVREMQRVLGDPRIGVHVPTSALAKEPPR